MKPGTLSSLAGAIALAAVIAGPSSAGAGRLSASMLADTCNGCHGPDGTSVGPAAPTIAGTNRDYLIEAMQAFRNGDRPSTIMQRIARGYSDEELELIAGYFAAKPFGRIADQKTDPGFVARGREIHEDLCEDCHEDGGRSAEDYPVLAGQLMAYLDYELADLISNRRDIERNDALSGKERRKKKRKLKELVDTYGKEGIAALVHFFASQN